jgi:hopanoid biosynthesis associated RND transporter like protein HpnN
LVVLAGLPLLTQLQFDFNPMNLRSPKVESVATFLELKRDPKTGANAVDVLAPSLAAAKEMAARLEKVPQVSEVRTLTSFIPTDQERKLALIREAKAALEPALNVPSRPAPSDAEKRSALAQAASALSEAARSENGPGAQAARRLAAALTRLHDGQEPVRAKAEAVLIRPLKTALDGLRAALGAEPVSEQTLPPDLVRQWMTPDGRVRVEALPKGDPNDNETLREFARAVLAVAPTATGGPISILESGRTIITAFIEAGIWALTSITLLLWVTLRRISDVLLTLAPLLLAGVVTLELCVLIGLQLNFANIIALPLLLGIGVAFKIYYVMAWRAGQTNLLQSTLTRAVIFSALTTAVAFGSLWLSNHPGTSSMGKLLALSLVCTLAAAVLFQPALMGRPRQIRDA